MKRKRHDTNGEAKPKRMRRSGGFFDNYMPDTAPLRKRPWRTNRLAEPQSADSIRELVFGPLPELICRDDTTAASEQVAEASRIAESGLRLGSGRTEDLEMGSMEAIQASTPQASISVLEHASAPSMNSGSRTLLEILSNMFEKVNATNSIAEKAIKPSSTQKQRRRTAANKNSIQQSHLRRKGLDSISKEDISSDDRSSEQSQADRTGTIFFLYGSEPSTDEATGKLIQLAIKAVQKAGCLHPKIIIVRGPGHGTTAQGRPKDPEGYHWTLSFKDDSNIRERTHGTCHAYTPGPGDFTLRDVAPSGNVKSDDLLKPSGAKTYWPVQKMLRLGMTFTY